MKKFFLWKKHGSKKLSIDSGGGDDPCSSAVYLFWDLTRAKFGWRPEPVSDFYNIVVVEHVSGNRVYITTARIGARNRAISMDCIVNGDGKLSFCVDKKRVLQVKRLKGKFRGNEHVEFDGVSFQVSWDVYNWLFENVSDGHVVLMFRFDKQGDEQEDGRSIKANNKHCLFTNSHNVSSTMWSSCSFRMNEIELRKMRKSMPRTVRSSSSSFASSRGSNSSMMQWASTKENELFGLVEFSLLSSHIEEKKEG